MNLKKIVWIPLFQHLPYKYKQKRCIHMTDKRKQNEAFATELFETFPNSLYNEVFQKGGGGGE